jgi:DNA ligase-associated metallophosphoesterase
MEILLENERLELLQQKAIYMPAHRVLLLADVHFGKVNHFRKAGIPVPLKANDRNTELLIELIQQTKPLRIIFLGDLFHSHYNEEWEVVGQITNHFKELSFELVVGNHDIMGEHQYTRHRFILHQKLTVGNLLLTHEEMTRVPAGFYNLAGHFHPGVRLHGKGRQSLMLPCFYFGKRKGLLPAFGSFTGLAKIRPRQNDKVYVIVEGRIVLLQE